MLARCTSKVLSTSLYSQQPSEPSAVCAACPVVPSLDTPPELHDLSRPHGSQGSLHRPIDTTLRGCYLEQAAVGHTLQLQGQVSPDVGLAECSHPADKPGAE